MLHLRNVVAGRNVTKPARKQKQTRRLAPVYPAMANEIMYRRDLLTLVNDIAKTVSKEVTPVATAEAARRTGADELVLDAKDPKRAPKKVEDAITKAQKKYKSIDELAEKEARKVVKGNLKTVDQRLTASIKKSVGVDIKGAFVTTPGLQKAVVSATKENVDLITSIPDEYFAKLRKSVRKGFESGMRPETLAKEIQRIGKVTESRARLIARDQTAKMNSSFNKERQLSVGVEKYEWQTSGDERVRPEHEEHNGKVFRWDDPPSDTGHPGEDIQCRCVAIPLF